MIFLLHWSFDNHDSAFQIKLINALAYLFFLKSTIIIIDEIVNKMQMSVSSIKFYNF